MRLGRAVWVADPVFARKLGCVGREGREGREGGRERCLTLHIRFSPTAFLSFFLNNIFAGVTLLPAIACLWKEGVG